MKRAITRMHLSLLENLLYLPKGCHIYGVVRTDEDLGRGTVSLCLEGEGIPEIDSDRLIPHVKITYEKVDGEIGLKEICLLDEV